MNRKLAGDLDGRKNTKTMDRLYNNEAIVGSVILLLLNSGDMEMARLSIVVPMIINDKLRNRLSRYTDNTIVENVKHCYADLTLNRIYQELLIIEINSLVMLSLSLIHISEPTRP